MARIGGAETRRTWTAPPEELGHSRPLTLSLERHVATVDVLAGYPAYRLVIKDGGHGYCHEFQTPTADATVFTRSCNVARSSNRVDFIMPDGETLSFPAHVILRQAGP